ncbi:hypothetical protein BS78_07G066100 [Paspalum vaginatum]|nr:hypothetical protein BS78_07G066100 [Paspalum vaginatum]
MQTTVEMRILPLAQSGPGGSAASHATRTSAGRRPALTRALRRRRWGSGRAGQRATAVHERAGPAACASDGAVASLTSGGQWPARPRAPHRQRRCGGRPSRVQVAFSGEDGGPAADEGRRGRPESSAARSAGVEGRRRAGYGEGERGRRRAAAPTQTTPGDGGPTWRWRPHSLAGGAQWAASRVACTGREVRARTEGRAARDAEAGVASCCASGTAAAKRVDGVGAGVLRHGRKRTAGRRSPGVEEATAPRLRLPTRAPATAPQLCLPAHVPAASLLAHWPPRLRLPTPPPRAAPVGKGGHRNSCAPCQAACNAVVPPPTSQIYVVGHWGRQAEGLALTLVAVGAGLGSTTTLGFILSLVRVLAGAHLIAANAPAVPVVLAAASRALVGCLRP